MITQGTQYNPKYDNDNITELSDKDNPPLTSEGGIAYSLAMLKNQSALNVVFITVLLLGFQPGLIYGEVAPENRTPYISTYYIEPSVAVGQVAKIGYYVTDFEQREYLYDDDSERFLIEYWVNGAYHRLEEVAAGDHELNLGVLPPGKVLFALQATDKLGVKSHRLYQEFRVIDPAAQAIKPEEVLYPDLAAFNISSNDTNPVATTVGLTALIRWASENGYRKVVLPEGRYRISETNTVLMASNVTLDMNGATFKLNPNALDKTMMLEFIDCYDAHVVNGTFEGDLLEHDFDTAPNNSEWVHALKISQGSEYCTVENLMVTNVTGYGTGTNHRHTYDRMAAIGDKFVPGDIDEEGNEIPSEVRTTNSNYIDIARFLESYGFIQLGVYLGYQGNPAQHWVYKAHFYDEAQRYIESIEGYLYRRLYPPATARYARFTLYSTAQPTTLCVYNFRSPYNCVFRNVKHVDVRCVGMAPCGLNNMLVEGCTFNNCGMKSAKCAFDAEDGWDLMQDFFFRNNVFETNPHNEFLTCAGHNFVMEHNVMKSYIYDRTRSYVLRGNQHKSATYKYGTGVRTGYSRVSGNTNMGLATMTSVTTVPDKWQAVRDDLCLGGVAGDIGQMLKFYRCEIKGGRLNAAVEACQVWGVTNDGSYFAISSSIVSNSHLKQSLVTKATINDSTLENSLLTVQGGKITVSGSQLNNTTAVIGTGWLTNCVFVFNDNVINLAPSQNSFLTVGNSFKWLLFSNNLVRATAPNLKFVTLTNPNASGTTINSNMWVAFANNRFEAAGGNLLHANYAPAGYHRLQVDFHTNVYNHIGFNNTVLDKLKQVEISILPALPTQLGVYFDLDKVPRNPAAPRLN